MASKSQGLILLAKQSIELVLSSMFQKCKPVHFAGDAASFPQGSRAECPGFPASVKAVSGAVGGEVRVPLDLYQRSGERTVQHLARQPGKTGKGAGQKSL